MAAEWGLLRILRDFTQLSATRVCKPLMSRAADAGTSIAAAVPKRLRPQRAPNIKEDSVMRTTNVLMATGLAVLVAATVAGPAAARTETQKAELESTGIDDDAAGKAQLAIKNGTEGRFDLVVKKLDRDATYDVLVNGVRVGAITTTGGGNGKIRFRSRPRSKRDLLLGFDPRGAMVAVERTDGAQVLQIALASPPDTGNVVCCVPDDSGTECEDRTEAECSAEGGTVSTATSCLPNPCATSPVPPADDDVICCIPDDSGPECEDRTSAECSAAGGVVVAGTTCLPSPCAPSTPPVDPDIQCCVPHIDGGFECEDRTPAGCDAEGGTNMGAGTCTPDPCAGL